jgi:hypothetical protein
MFKTSAALIVRVAVLGLVLSSARTANAQESTKSPSPWEVRVTGGSFVPTGEQRNVLKEGKVKALQVTRLLRPSLAITGTFGWARSQDLATADNPKLDVFTSDLGIELRPNTWFANRAVNVDAFVGIGGGMRSYNYRKLDIGATHNLAAYGAIGGEVGIGRVGVRLEVRDYVAGFKPLAGVGDSQTRNDVVITAAIRINRNASR